MAERFDLVRLAELRDAHAGKVAAYRRSTEQVRDAAQAATRARLEAPPLPGAPPPMTRHALPPGIGQVTKPMTVRPRTSDFYLQPLAMLKAFTPAQLEDGQIDTRALARIVAAETRLERLRAEHLKQAAAVRDSASFMRGIELFSLEKRL
jgi:hypothetical protein